MIGGAVGTRTEANCTDRQFVQANYRAESGFFSHHTWRDIGKKVKSVVANHVVE